MQGRAAYFFGVLHPSSCFVIRATGWFISVFHPTILMLQQSGCDSRTSPVAQCAPTLTKRKSVRSWRITADLTSCASSSAPDPKTHFSLRQTVFNQWFKSTNNQCFVRVSFAEIPTSLDHGRFGHPGVDGRMSLPRSGPSRHEQRFPAQV